MSKVDSYEAFVDETDRLHLELIPGDSIEKVELRRALGGALWLLVTAMREIKVSKAPNGMTWNISGFVISISRPHVKSFGSLYMASEVRASRAREVLEELVQDGKIDAESADRVAVILKAPYE